jgi:thiosulfate dehydrogenase [quinone] large subunit
MNLRNFFLNGLRLALSFTFLWAFLDKTFGLGFATVQAKAWIKGGSPTFGFLSNAPVGPFADFFNSLAGVFWIDWVFMIGLLFVGLTLLFNKFIKWGSVAGILMLFLMYLAVLPPANNPIVDDHIISIFALGVVAIFSSNKYY